MVLEGNSYRKEKNLKKSKIGLTSPRQILPMALPPSHSPSPPCTSAHGPAHPPAPSSWHAAPRLPSTGALAAHQARNRPCASSVTPRPAAQQASPWPNKNFDWPRHHPGALLASHEGFLPLTDHADRVTHTGSDNALHAPYTLSTPS